MCTENQRNEHVGEAIKRREPNIGRLIKAYNKLCADISALIRTKKAPRGVVAPLPIPEKGLYQLDVDDVIWQDVGLDDNAPGGSPPLWLADANVRSGIRAMLQKDRCGEEAPRLLCERGHLQIWFAMEWKLVCEMITMTEGVFSLFLPGGGSFPDERRGCTVHVSITSTGALGCVEEIFGPYRFRRHGLARMGANAARGPRLPNFRCYSILGYRRQRRSGRE